jgi:hypothetical protein
MLKALSFHFNNRHSLFDIHQSNRTMPDPLTLTPQQILRKKAAGEPMEPEEAALIHRHTITVRAHPRRQHVFGARFQHREHHRR